MIHIISGGTYFYIRPHLALCAPAAGNSGRQMYQMLQNAGQLCQLHQTQMAGGHSLRTNEDVADAIKFLCGVEQTKAIIICAALCDFEVTEMDAYLDNGDPEENMPIGKEYPRLKTSEVSELSLLLEPAAKILNHVKVYRPDIVLAGFKTTTLATIEEQKVAADTLAFNSGADLVLANDLVSRRHLVTTFAGDILLDTLDRTSALQRLVDEVIIRCSR